MALVLDGRALANKIQKDLQKEVSQWDKRGLRLPKLVVILVGDDQASQVYVRNKERAVKEIGFYSEVIRLDKNISEDDLLSIVQKCNQDKDIDGILIQLPLPKQINEKRILLAVDPKKDVDGFHPFNVGELMTSQAEMVPCTPYGIIRLLKEYNITLSGKKAVIVGRSNIVGKPVAQMLLDEDATVTITHSKTPNLAEETRRADILIVAIGQGEMITSEYVKPGAVVIDVGMNRNAQGKLVGDVEYSSVSEVASAITPVPGGVGPMTITMLMEQTIKQLRKDYEV